MIIYKKVDHKNREEVYQLICSHEYSWRDSDPHGYKAKTEEERQKTVDYFIEKQNETNVKDTGFLAIEKGKVLGGHLLEIINVDGRRACHIHVLWVDSSYRGQGIASELKKLGEAWAIENECSLIDSNVRVSNKGMVALNKKLGFQIVRYNFRKPL